MHIINIRGNSDDDIAQIIPFIYLYLISLVEGQGYKSFNSDASNIAPYGWLVCFLDNSFLRPLLQLIFPYLDRSLSAKIVSGKINANNQYVCTYLLSECQMQWLADTCCPNLIRTHVSSAEDYPYFVITVAKRSQKASTSVKYQCHVPQKSQIQLTSIVPSSVAFSKLQEHKKLLRIQFNHFLRPTASGYLSWPTSLSDKDATNQTTLIPA